MRRPRRSPLGIALANIGWFAVGLVSLAFCLALWAAVIWTGVSEPYDPWHERAYPYKD